MQLWPEELCISNGSGICVGDQGEGLERYPEAGLIPRCMWVSVETCMLKIESDPWADTARHALDEAPPLLPLQLAHIPRL